MVVTRPGAHRYGDPNLARGAGETSLRSPLRSPLDYQSALADTVQNAGERIRQVIGQALDGAVAEIYELSGIDLSSIPAFLASLNDGAGIDLPALPNIIAALQGVPWQSGEPGAILRAMAGPIGDLIESLVAGGQPINARNLFGSILPELLGVVPSGSLSPVSPNRAINPTFTADAIAPAPDWSVDMSSSRTPGDGSGSALVIADGRPHALNSGRDPNDRLPVSPGQRVTKLVNISHHGASVIGPAVLLQVRPFSGPTQLPYVELSSYTPAVPDLAWPGHPMSGTYVVPEGVTDIQMRVYLTENALAGQFRADDVDINQVADLSLFPGLPEALQALDQRGDAILNGIASAARGFPVVGASIADVMEALAAFNPANIAGTLGSSNLTGDVQAILNNLVGGLLGRRVTGASVEDLYNAANQSSNNVAGVDEMVYVIETRLVPLPAFAQWIDAIGCSRGQDGQDGKLGFFGEGGAVGKVAATTWQRGVHFDEDVTAVQVTLHSNGSVTIAIPGHSLTVPAGSGPQTHQLFGGWVGHGRSEPFIYNGKAYALGGDQNQPGGAGISPGGGGGGGRGILIPNGGPGGSAAAFLRFRADTVPNQSTGSDSTPPSPPTSVNVVAATNSTLTFAVSGSVDG